MVRIEHGDASPFDSRSRSFAPFMALSFTLHDFDVSGCADPTRALDIDGDVSL